MINTWYEDETTRICELSNNKIVNDKELIRNNNMSHNLTLFNDNNTSENILNKLGIQKEKYICIYSRDSKYLSKRFPDLDWNYHNHRNSDIDNLSALANFITSELNLDVVRVGSNAQKAISWSKETFPKIIYYSFSEYVNRFKPNKFC